jgi:glycosyltransferase involved in cell wall biosynthesis
MDKLILFTSSFPFGNKETYLEREIDFLSKYFDKVEIYPHYYNQGNRTQREVPENVKVHEAALPIGKSKRLLQSLKGVFKGAKLGIFVKEFFSKKVYTSKPNLKSWLITMNDYLATVGSSQYDEIKGEKNAVFYFYWGFGWSYIILDFDHAKSFTSYVRLHGSEVYLGRSNGYIPLRKKLFQKADFLLPISVNLSEYLNTRYDVLSKKIKVSRLGVFMPSDLSNGKAIDSLEMHLVSCSNMIKLKRIDMIVKSLKFFDGRSVKWIHFGDGVEMKAIRKLIDASEFKTITVELAGSRPNAEVLDYYKNNKIDAFVNVSKHEGVPVSIMEAMSYGIPCIATNVGATSEIVNNENGILLDEDFSINDLVKSLQAVKFDQWKKKRGLALSHCNQFFNAKKNYKQLIRILKKK